MYQQLTNLSYLLDFLDTGAGVFSTDAESIVEDRKIETSIVINNDRGETVRVNLDDLVQLGQLLSLPEETELEGAHPITVLNTVWHAFKGVHLEGHPENVASFRVNLHNDKFVITINYLDGSDYEVSHKSNVAVRVFILKHFALIDKGLRHGIAAWCGKAEIFADLVAGTLAIEGVQVNDVEELPVSGEPAMVFVEEPLDPAKVVGHVMEVKDAELQE